LVFSARAVGLETRRRLASLEESYVRAKNLVNEQWIHLRQRPTRVGEFLIGVEG